MRYRRLVADKAARAVAQHGLFFGEDECHWEIPLSECSIGFSVDPHGEEAPLRRLEPCGPWPILRDAAKGPLLRMRSLLRPRQIEDALGDDAEHHLRGSALDRIGLGAQPGP